MLLWTDATVRSVACTECGALPGHNCNGSKPTRNGVPWTRIKNHRSRINEYLRVHQLDKQPRVHHYANVDAVSELEGRRMASGLGGDRVTINGDFATLSGLLKMRAAYQACIKVSVEVDYCERRISELDGMIRAYIADHVS